MHLKLASLLLAAVAAPAIAGDLPLERVFSSPSLSGPTPRQAKASTPADVHTRAAEDKLKIQLGTRVRIIRKSRGGRIEIDFTSEDELIRIYDALMGQ